VKPWERFVALFDGGDPSEKTDYLHLGRFNIGYLRLRDLGLAEGVKQITVRGRRVWVGKFRHPLTEDLFLSDGELQYRVFCRDMLDRCQLVMPMVGRSIDGIEATLSGFLAVAKLAGTKGFMGWVNDVAERQHFVRTTAAFWLANGIF
jgi:hypothetical protein